MSQFCSEKLTEEEQTEQYCFTESEESKLYRKFLNKWKKVWTDNKCEDEGEKNMREATEDERGNGCDKIHEIL